MKARGICERLKEQILGGVFDAAGRLPSSRALAQELGVSRTTVTSAYEQLAAEGFILLQRGKRPQVAPDLGGVAARRGAPAGQPAARLSAYGARLRQFMTPPVFRDARLIVDFRYGDMGRAEFPDALWKKAMVAALASQPPRLAYDDPEGNIRLRRALQGYLWRARKLTCDLDQIVVVNGSQQGLDLCARLLLDPGDSFVMENPGYPLARQVLAGTGAQALPLPVDSDGLETERLGALSARLAYVTPSHQYPLGGVMPVPRRRQLLDWARREAAWVIEDDYDSEYRYDVNPVPPLLGLDEAERVIYLGTVSKILSPRLRLGYLVVPVALREAFVTAKRLTDRHTAVTEQEALASLIESGAYERHVRRVRRSNGERRAALIEAVRRHLGPEAVVQGADAGLHMVLWLPGLTPAEEGALVAGCRARGVGVHPVRALYDESAPPADGAGIGLVMGYAAVDIRLIDRGIRLLAETVRRLRNGDP